MRQHSAGHLLFCQWTGCIKGKVGPQTASSWNLHLQPTSPTSLVIVRTWSLLCITSQWNSTRTTTFVRMAVSHLLFPPLPDPTPVFKCSWLKSVGKTALSPLGEKPNGDNFHHVHGSSQASGLPLLQGAWTPPIITTYSQSYTVL